MFPKRERVRERDFPIRSCARAWTSVILARKSGSRRHSITGFSENVAVAEICYQRLEVLSFCDRQGEGLTFFNENNHANSSGEKKRTRQNKTKTKESKMKLFSGVYIFWEYAKEIDRSLISPSRSSSYSNLKIPSNCLMINVFCTYLSTFKSYICCGSILSLV